METKQALEYLDALATYKNGGRINISFGIQKDVEAYQKVWNLKPKVLYKYRRFDGFTEEMLKEPYLYLASAKSLDDPFECSLMPLNDFTDQALIVKLTSDAEQYVINLVLKDASDQNKEVIKHILQRVYRTGSFKMNNRLFLDLLGEISDESAKKEAMEMFNKLNNLFSSFPQDGAFSEKIEEAFAGAVLAREFIGICSLAEENDNQALWAMYGDNCKGYCVAYEFPDDVIYSGFLLPVTYDANRHTNPIKALLDSALGGFLLSLSGGAVGENTSSLIRTFTNKDPCWSFQNEWRLLGDKREPYNKFNKFKIKGIYVGPLATDADCNLVKGLGYPVYRGIIDRRISKIVFKPLGD